MRARVCVYMYIRVCVCIHIYIYIYMYMYMCIYVYKYICIYVSVYLCIHIHVCIYIYIHNAICVNDRFIYVRAYIHASPVARALFCMTTILVVLRRTHPSRKGTNGVSTNGVTANLLFLTEELFGAPVNLLLSTQKCQAVPVSPIRQNSLLLQRPHEC